jgi:hypothetical protein
LTEVVQKIGASVYEEPAAPEGEAEAASDDDEDVVEGEVTEE